MEIPESAVLIRITRSYSRGMSPEDLYEATRKWWRMDARRDPDYAFAVNGGQVKAVYKIDGWERSGDSGRRAFRGNVDEEMSRRYVGADVSRYVPQGAANPIRFVNA